MPELVTPSARYRASFLEALREPDSENWMHHPHVELAHVSFDTFLQQLADEAAGLGLSADKVPQSSFWLVDGDQYIGRVSIRHRLNDKLRRMGGNIGYAIRPSARRQGHGKLILQLALQKARALGMQRVLLTCSETNMASRKIIEHCGGVFEGADVVIEGQPPKRRYWITIDTDT